QLETLTLPSAGDLPAETVRYYYDAANQPEWMGSGRGWGTYVSDTAYSALGQLLQQRMGTTWAYFIGYTYESGTRRLTGTALYRQANAGFSTDVDMTYSYDDYGNPTSVTDTAGTTDRQCFRYDGLGRLTSAWTSATSGCDAPTSWSGIGGPAPYWQTYTYTAVGDRSTVVARTAAGASTSTYTYPASGAPRPHAVTAVTTTGVSPASASFGYDAAGNTTTRSVGTLAAALTWTPEGQLATVDENTSIGVEGTYTYTADGDRLVRVHEGATTVYLPGGQEVTAANGVVSVERTYTFAGRPVATRTGISPTQLWSLVVDPHHSASVAINNGATPGDSTAVVKRRMDPFGNPRGTNPAWPTDKGFLNKPTDATGLTHIGARYYDAAFGRFISVDPIMNLSDPNQWAAYAYANNNPVTNWDPTGLVTYRDGETAGQAQRRQGSGPKV
ncbi:MAG TPA: RHS repeat-associated core domain-containing protein, partial [Actinotalea sp.]|nr:RHS repeat-associated core domain-containing protein [Actinotalea sp.]